MPRNEELTNSQLADFAERMKIRNFRGVFARDRLPNAPNADECGIVNLDDSTGPGTHWVAYYKKRGRTTVYFDSFGRAPPRELTTYLGPAVHDTVGVQSQDEIVCGQYCLFFLHHMNEGGYFPDVLDRCRR